jgi:Flp pilus assembly protein TadD
MGLAMVCLEALGQRDQVETSLKETLADTHLDFDYLVALGNQLSDLGALEQAETVLEELNRRDDGSHVPPFNLAVLRSRQERFDEALDQFRTALKRRPDFAPAVLGIADCLRFKGDMAGASASYRDYLRLVPDDIDYWVGLGIVESEMGHFEEADRVYQHAESIDPRSVALYYNWTVTAAMAENRERIEECVSKLEDMAAEDWRTAMARSLKSESEGQIWQGWEACQEAVELAMQTEDPESLEGAVVTAMSFAERNQLVEQGVGLAERMFEIKLYSPNVFNSVRVLNGRKSPKALDYLVTLHGTLRDGSAISEEFSHNDEQGDGPPYYYYCSYRVMAQDEDEASQAALDFESQYGDGERESLSVDSVETEGETEASEDYLGILYRSDVHVYSGQSQEE